MGLFSSPAASAVAGAGLPSLGYPGASAKGTAPHQTSDSSFLEMVELPGPLNSTSALRGLFEGTNEFKVTPAVLEQISVAFMQQNAALEQSNAALERRNAALEVSNADLERRH